MVTAQGGDPCAVDDPGRLPVAACVSPVPAPRAGRVHRVDAEAIGRVALRLGAGRQRADETVDPAAGVSDVLPAGTEVAAGQPLMRLHSRDAATAGALVPEAAAAVTLGDGPAPATSLIIEDLPAHATP
jgi:thymidine phosphorylase